MSRDLSKLEQVVVTSAKTVAITGGAVVGCYLANKLSHEFTGKMMTVGVHSAVEYMGKLVMAYAPQIAGTAVGSGVVASLFSDGPLNEEDHELKNSFYSDLE